MDRIYRVVQDGETFFAVDNDGGLRRASLLAPDDGIGPIVAGDTVCVKVDGVGALVNSVENE